VIESHPVVANNVRAKHALLRSGGHIELDLELTSWIVIGSAPATKGKGTEYDDDPAFKLHG
jgi:hypothetical protein